MREESAWTPPKMKKMTFDKMIDVALRIQSPEETTGVLKAMLHAVDLGVMLTNLDHITLAVNRRFGEIWHVDPLQIVESDVHGVRGQVANRISDPVAWASNLEEVYSDPNRVQVDEFILVNPHQVLRRFTGPVQGETGTPVGRLWTFQDITTEHRTNRINKALSAASLLYDPSPRVIYQKIVDVVAEFYGSLAILSLLEGSYLRFHVAGGELAPAALEFRGNELEASLCQFCLASSQPTVIQDILGEPAYENLLPAKAGFTRYAGVPLINPEGQFVGTLCILDHKSDEILGEEDVRFLQLLAMRIASELDREAQLARLQEKLVKTEAELEQMQRNAIQREKLAIVGTLSATIAHDIRNILSAISLEISMGHRRPQETLQVVQEHLDRFNLLSHRLLSYAKPGKLMTQPVSLSESLNRILPLLTRMMQLGKVELVVTSGDEVPMILAEDALIDHLLMNLCLNSIQAMKKGGLLTVAIRQENSRVVLEIRDQGPGLTDQQKTEMFEPFRSDRQGGVGLGLYSVLRTIQETDGELQVLNIQPQGAQFLISWPVR